MPGYKWGSAVVLSSGTIDPIEIPNYRGWVVGGEVHESSLQTDGQRMFVFSLHSPTSSTTAKRSTYIQEVDSVVSILEKVIPAECDLILGGDFNFTIGERQAGELQPTQPSERDVIRKLEQLGLSERTKRRIEELADDAEIRLTQPQNLKARVSTVGAKSPDLATGRDKRLSAPGNCIQRVYKDKIIQVIVLCTSAGVFQDN